MTGFNLFGLLIPGLLGLIAVLGLYHGATGRPADKSGPRLSIGMRSLQIAAGVAALLGVVGYFVLAYGPPID
jgi:hypothetical protein